MPQRIKESADPSAGLCGRRRRIRCGMAIWYHMQIKLGIYKHYKGHTVRVIGVAKHSETLEDLVVYDHMGTNELSDLRVRPLAMFFEDVEVDGVKMPRFEFIGE